MKLLVTASTFPRWEGDTEPKFVFELSKRLARRFEVFVLCPGTSGAKESEVVAGLQIRRYKYFPYRFGSLAYEGGILPKLKKNKLYYLQVPFFLLLQLWTMKKIIEEHNIHAIHAHWLVPQGIVAAIYKRLFDPKVRIAVTVHGGDLYGLRNPLGKWMKQFALKNADEVAVVSNALKDELSKYNVKGRIHVYPMGIDTNLFSPERRDDSLRTRLGIEGPFLLFVGRLAEKKGVRFLLDALPGILKEFPNSKLVIVGGGPLQEDLSRQASQLGISDSTIFTGPIEHDELPRYFSTADLFVGPSTVAESGDTEGFGLVFAEAMSCGTAVVATNLSSIADIVIDNQTGFVVRQGSAAEITRAIITLMKDRKKLDSVKEDGRCHVKANFEWDIVAERYACLLKSFSDQ